MSLKVTIAIAILVFWLTALVYCAWTSRSKSTKQDAVKYRNDKRGFFLASQYYFTGYATSFRVNRDENDRKSRIYQLPRELVIQVMEHLSPEDLYLARQASGIFFSLFKKAAFKQFHEIPSVRRWNPLYVWGKPPEDEGRSLIFKTHIFLTEKAWSSGLEKRKYIAQRLLRDRVCRQCAESVKLAHPAPSECLFCVHCGREHKVSCFSDRETKKENPVCLAWEGKQRICPHRHISMFEPFHFKMDMENNPTFNVFECAECKSALGMKKHEQPPALKCVIFMADGEDSFRTLEHSWKATVATLSKDEVVTKELLLQDLERLDDILCPQTRSGASPRILLDSFQRYQCVCFRGPMSEGRPLCHANHAYVGPDTCCACHTISHESVGKFMAPRKLSGYCEHEVRCSTCSATYRWSLQGNRIMLQMRRVCTSTELVRIAQDKYAAKLKPRGLEKYISSLDPETYQGNKYTPKTYQCGDIACRNYRLAMGSQWSF